MLDAQGGSTQVIETQPVDEDPTPNTSKLPHAEQDQDINSLDFQQLTLGEKTTYDNSQPPGEIFRARLDDIVTYRT